MSEITLREYFERRLEDLERRHDERFDTSDSAVAKAERLMSARLESMNEFRDALKDQASRMATREELYKLAEDVRTLQRVNANVQGRLMIVPIVISGIISLGLTIIALWISSAIRGGN